MAKIKHYGGVLLTLAISLFALNIVLKYAWPSGRSYLGLNG